MLYTVKLIHKYGHIHAHSHKQVNMRQYLAERLFCSLGADAVCSWRKLYPAATGDAFIHHKAKV